MNDVSLPRRRVRGKAFSPEEDAILRDMWGKASADEIGKAAGRPAASVYARARLLGLPAAVFVRRQLRAAADPVRGPEFNDKWERFLSEWRLEYRRHVRPFVQTGFVGKGPAWLHDVRKS